MGIDTLEGLVADVQAKQCESQTVEIKAARDGAPRLYDTISSFSNQNDGGVIIFGLDESDRFKAAGVYDAHELQKSVCEQCAEMSPEVRPVFADALIDGKVIVAAYIEGRPMSERPVYRLKAGMTKGSYVRLGDADKHMTPSELYEIEVFKNGKRDDVSVSPEASLNMLDEDLVSSFVVSAKEDRPHMARRKRDEILKLTGAEKEGKPTLSGMMTLCDYPQQIYPNLCITASAVAGTEIVTGSDGSRFLDNKRFEGPIAQMIDDAIAFVKRNTKTRVVVRDGVRHDISEYPENAVREIITNSLMHRDYGPYCNGTPVRLTLYSDRLECWNPGGVYGGQSVEDLGYANIQTRNPTLVSILEIQGVGENRHSGIPVIRDEMRAAGLRPPVFSDVRGSFQAQLFNAPEEASEPKTRQAKPAAADVRDEIVAFCAIPRSRNEIADHLGLNARYLAKTHLTPLVQEGKLQLTMPEKPRSKFQRFIAKRAARPSK
ncbi:ATP-binding protein [Arabiibacter massiliensis]|uniref:ATP-binding protein n=1 Tax=Arabiibacter massiliensis TaxID=1870985 RepID=UPI0009BBB1BA|nr:ATP-binding protein [Arabiibacter massiliensis]